VKLKGNYILHGEALETLKAIPKRSHALIYVDPPFNTGRVQELHAGSYEDSFESYGDFLYPILRKAVRRLTERGSLFVHLDRREVHYVKVFLDELMGRACFRNEIIWAYDFGGRSKVEWPHKHDTILWYSRDPKHWTFHYDQIDRIPYMTTSPGLVSPEKLAKGKTPTDVWWNTIVPTMSKERTGYPSQKPLPILRRILNVHSSPGDRVLDCFAGSGTTGDAAAELGRVFTLIDRNPEAIRVMSARLQHTHYKTAL